jgi:hypothetical protein
VDEQKNETVPLEQKVDSPRGANADQEALLHGLEPRHDVQLKTQLAPAYHTALPYGYRVRSRILLRGLVRQLYNPISKIKKKLL